MLSLSALESGFPQELLWQKGNYDKATIFLCTISTAFSWATTFPSCRQISNYFMSIVHPVQKLLGVLYASTSINLWRGQILSRRVLSVQAVTQSIYGAESIGVQFWKANETTYRFMFFVNCFERISLVDNFSSFNDNFIFLAAYILSQICVSRSCLRAFLSRQYLPIFLADV